MKGFSYFLNKVCVSYCELPKKKEEGRKVSTKLYGIEWTNKCVWHALQPIEENQMV